MSSSSKPEVQVVAGKLSTAEGFILGGIAACIAVCDRIVRLRQAAELSKTSQVTISNPAEVIKTRLQLQGELAKEGAIRVYQHAPDAFVKTWKNEGIKGLQRGLGPAVRRHISDVFRVLTPKFMTVYVSSKLRLT